MDEKKSLDSKGQTVALVGPTGSGKSACIQLIQNFYQPQGGRVLIDGVDIGRLSPQWLRRHTGAVVLGGQDQPVLFSNCTIEENIRYGANDPSATRRQVLQACRVANADTFIKCLPKVCTSIVQ